MPEDNLGLDESRIRLLRHGPDVQFKSFRRAAIPDVDVPGNMLHVRPVGALGRNEVPASESSWIAVLMRQARTDEEEPHCVYVPTDDGQDPIYVYFARVLRLGEVGFFPDESIQVAEVVWARRAQQDTETMLWSINTNDPTNVDYTEPFVPIDDVIPVAVAKDPSSNYIWVLNCRISRHLDAILNVSV